MSWKSGFSPIVQVRWPWSMDYSTFATDPIQSLSDEDVVAILNELPRRPMLAGKDGLRLSLAGAQDKLPVVFDGARVHHSPG